MSAQSATITSLPAPVSLAKTETLPGLSPGKQERGQHLLHLSQIFNALAYACLADHVLTLYALKLGAGALYVGFLSSLVHLTMFLGVLGKRIAEKRGPVYVYGISWMLRYLFAGLMALAPFAAVRFGVQAGLAVLLMGALLFFSFRAIGNNANTLIVARIAAPYQRGHLVATQFTIFYIGSVLILLAFGLLLGRSAPLWRFQAFIVFGVLMGAISGFIALRIPEIVEPKAQKPVTLRQMYTLFAHTPALRNFLFSGMITRAVVAAAIPFLVVSMRLGAGWSEDRILLLVIFLSLGNVLASFFNRMYLDRLGARPMMILYVMCLCVALFAWVLTPGTSIVYIALNFLLFGLVSPGFTSAQVPYLFNWVRPREQYAASLFSEIAMGFAAFNGAFIGGVLISKFQSAMPAGLTPFRWYFGMLAVLALAAVLLTQRLSRSRDRRLREVLNIFFSPRDLMALFYLSNLASRLTEEEEVEALDRIGELGSQLSEKELLEGLASPRLVVRGDALHALRSVPPTPAIARALMDEVQSHEFTTAYLAADLLGVYGVREAIPLLRASLRSEDLFLQSKAILALGRMRDEDSYPALLQIFRSTDNPRLLIHSMNAFGFFGKTESIKEILQRLPEFETTTVRGEAFLSLADLCGTGEEFYSDYKAYLLDPNIGASILLDLAEKQRAPLRRQAAVEIARAYSLDAATFKAALLSFCRAVSCEPRMQEILRAFEEYLRDEKQALEQELRFCLAYYCLAMGLREE
ncbi:MAG: MFS transporter [candidate division KSB1 bacterium]